MSQRYFVEQPITGDRVEVTGPEAHHLARVMRAAVGDEYVLFDGRGGECTATVTRVSKQAVELNVVERRQTNRETTQPLLLAVALPKGDRQHWLVEKAVELGVTKLLPLITERGVAEPGEAARERMQRWGIEACKQCGRNRLMEIAEPAAIGDLAATRFDGLTRLVAHPGGKFLGLLPEPPSGVIAAIGPEGGFTDDEADTLTSAGWARISLGPRILRVETAAIALAAWWGLRDSVT